MSINTMRMLTITFLYIFINRIEAQQCLETQVAVLGMCMDCIFPCYSCEVTVTQCLSCQYGYRKEGYSCFSCPTQTTSKFNPISKTQECVPCQYPCRNCEGIPSKCSDCYLGFMISDDYKCLADCVYPYVSNQKQIGLSGDIDLSCPEHNYAKISNDLNEDWAIRNLFQSKTFKCDDSDFKNLGIQNNLLNVKCYCEFCQLSNEPYTIISKTSESNPVFYLQILKNFSPYGILDSWQVDQSLKDSFMMPDQRFMALITDNKIQFYDIWNKKFTGGQLALNDQIPVNFAFSRDNKFMIVAYQNDQKIYFFRLNSKEDYKYVNYEQDLIFITGVIHQCSLANIVLSMNKLGNYFASACDDNFIVIWNSGSQKEVTIFISEQNSQVTSIHISEQNDYLFVGYLSGVLETYDLLKQELLKFSDAVEQMGQTGSRVQNMNYYEQSKIIWVSTLTHFFKMDAITHEKSNFIQSVSGLHYQTAVSKNQQLQIHSEESEKIYHTGNSTVENILNQPTLPILKMHLFFCPKGKFIDQASGQCLNCVKPCLSCQSSLYCNSCEKGYFFHNNKCLEICPEDHYSDYSLSRCVKPQNGIVDIATYQYKERGPPQECSIESQDPQCLV